MKKILSTLVLFATLSLPVLGSLPVTDNLICRLNGSDVAVDENGFITQWNDQSGHNNSAVNMDPNSYPREPFLLQNALAGHNVIDMAKVVNGVDDGYYNVLTIPSNPTDFDKTNFTWFIVYKPVDNATRTILSTRYTDPTYDRLWGTYHDTRIISNARTNTGTSVAELGKAGEGMNGWNLVAAVWDSTGAATIDDQYDDIDQYINGVKSTGGQTLLTAQSVTGHIGTSIGSTFSVADGAVAGFAGYFDGQIAEILIYNASLSAEQIHQVGSYLANKYGLDTIYPATTCAAIWGKGEGIAYDLDRNCEIGIGDVSILAQKWLDCNDPAGCN